MAATVTQCICSHPATDHVDTIGRCVEPTGTCCCEGYSELCPKCSHGKYSHDGTNNVCTRKVIKTGLQCGCTRYTDN